MRVYLLIFLLAISSFLAAQAPYSVGTATQSIEPGSAILSSALSGYGFPKEGRFSLTWDSVVTIPLARSIVGYKGQLYLINAKHQLLVGALKGNDIVWRKKSDKMRWKLIAASSDGLFGISTANTLLKGIIHADKIVWKRISNIKAPTFFLVHGSNYLKKEGNTIFIGPLNFAVKPIYKEKDEIDFLHIVSNGAYLYGINKGDSLYKGEINGNKLSWLQIGRNNGITFKDTVRNLLFLNGSLYGVSSKNVLLKAKHYSDNSLSVSALAIKSENKTIVVVGLDLVNFDANFIRSIKAEVSQRRGLPESAILINASHTHFAPVTYPWLTWETFYQQPDPKYLAQVRTATVRAIENAIDNMKPSKIYFTRGTTNIGRNRRPANNPEKPYDNTLDLLRIETGSDRSVLFLTGCHPVLSNKPEELYQLSANYPGVARTVLKKDLNLKDAIFLQGAGADINPRNKDYSIIGNELAINVEEIYKQEGELLSGKISYTLDTIKIPIKAWSTEQITLFKTENLKLKGKIEADKNVRWADLMLQKYQQKTVEKYMPIYVQVINVGRWRMVGLSREVVTEYGPAIRNLWPEKIVSVAGYCNDVSSYLPNSWHTKAGVYEGNESFYWYGQPAIFPEDTFQILIEKIRSLTTN